MHLIDPERRQSSPSVLLRRIASRVATAQNAGADLDHRAISNVMANPDAALIRCCSRVAQVERRKRALFRGPDSIQDDIDRDARLDVLDRAQLPDLRRIIGAAPASWQGHRIRVATFQLLDAGGLYAAARAGSATDRLLLAIIHDLAAS